jgi:hypothetical protein
LLREEKLRSASAFADLQKSQRLVEEERSRLEEKENALASLLDERLPGLHRIEYNKLVDVNDKYVLNVTFAKSGVEDSKFVEYHALLVNNTQWMLLPQVEIFLFDDVGIQVGGTKLDHDQATNNAALPELEPGETRSYHSRIEVERDAVPKYYALFVE